jgi:tRNA threonylcarbamoyladenosine biosynthesis protein TsaE
VKTWSFDSPDPDTTRHLASLLGRSIGERGLVIGLVGPLGAGKTVFVKGLAEGLGVEPSSVSSPTFVIAQQYPVPAAQTPGPHVLHHVDLYRLESEDELDAIGFSDLFDVGSVMAAEWSDRFPGVLGPERLEIELEGPSLAEETTKRGRRAQVRAYGEVAEAALEDWVERAERASRSRPGSGTEGMGLSPQRRAVGLLCLSLALAGVVRLETSNTYSVCLDPVSTEEDALGTLRVDCRSGGAGAAPNGIGGLLFGMPMPLASVSVLQLEALPGIGPSRARAIVEARREAPFERLGDLERISGIGPKTVDALSAWLVTDSLDKPSPRMRSHGRDAGNAPAQDPDHG